MKNSNVLYGAAQTSAVPTGETVRDNTILLKLTVSGMGFKKKVEAETVIEDKDLASYSGVTKNLIDPAYLSPIGSLDSRIRTRVNEMGFRPGFVHSGFVLLPVTAVMYVEKMLEEYRDSRALLVRGLADTMEVAKYEARMKLGPIYNERDYPSETEIMEKFEVQHEYLTLSVPETLQQIDRELFIQQEDRAGKLWDNALGEIRTALRLSFKDITGSMTDKLENMAETKKIFTKGYVDKVREFLETFDLKHITQDPKLADLVGRTRKILEGESPDSIRQDDSVRLRILNVMKSVDGDLGALMSQ